MPVRMRRPAAPAQTACSGNAVLLARLAHEVEGVADVDEAVDMLAARVLLALECALVLSQAAY